MMDNKKYILYCFTNKINGKKYIGITSQKMKNRIKQHIREAYQYKNYKTYNTPFKRAIRKYGIDNFKKEILKDNLTKDEAIELEKEYIKKYKTYYKYSNSNGYNATIGGDLIICPKDRIYQLDEVSCEIINIFDSISLAINQLKNSHIGDCVDKINLKASNYIWMYEKTYIKYDKNLLYKNIHILHNHIVQLDMNKNLIKIWKGSKDVKLSLGYNQGNISACCRGVRYQCHNYRWMFYKDWINNKDRYNKKNRCKKVIQLDMNNNELKIFNSLTEASKQTGVDISNISTVCKNRAISAGGYKWKYYNS